MSQEYQVTITFISEEKKSKTGTGTYYLVKGKLDPGLSEGVAQALGVNNYGELTCYATPETIAWFTPRLNTVVTATAGKGKFDVDFAANQDVPVVQVAPPPAQEDYPPDQEDYPPDPAMVDHSRPANRPDVIGSGHLADAEVRMRNAMKVYKLAWDTAKDFMLEEHEHETNLVSTSDIRALATTLYLEAPVWRLIKEPRDIDGFNHPDYGMLWSPRSAIVVKEAILTSVNEREFTATQKTSIHNMFMSTLTKMGGEEERKMFCTAIFGEGSSKKLTSAQKLAVCKWSGAVKETNYKVAIPAHVEYMEVIRFDWS